ncbi:ADP-glyceromanno-heptose 6-epimerase [Desulfurobacterium atlanticum]|uniref:ADP-L-glycero-D-manno-heptose 6-epimerase n=1 Tax=Desulfurobacterium atlanticum TaxID=240169 RepID=A0A238YP99_9BACT|nr:ADP-glyceromanno-heptose 6-epimerase [Desulfurobacterium atlanticum]SNR72249.1 ADP-L-glycero-D-manno-heptose 6-epimerase [Desulfurobacterium atlanticum]
MKRFLVTGGAGFIGSNLALELRKRYPDAEVVVLDDFSSGHFKNLIGFDGEIITGSITDPETVKKIEERNFDVIFHQAANVDTTDTRQKEMMEVNCEAFKTILQTALKNNSSIIYASSAAVYGNGEVPMKVNQKLLPENVYGFSKYAMDMVAYKFIKEHPEIHIVGLRYFNVYGPRETFKGKMASMVLKLAVQIMKGKKPRLFKWGEQKRDFVYVMDCVEANIKGMESEKSGIVNVGTGKARTFNDVVKIIKESLGIEVETEYFDNPYKFYQNYTEADLTETEQILGWTPETPIEKGIPEYIEWIRENVDLDEIDF